MPKMTVEGASTPLPEPTPAGYSRAYLVSDAAMALMCETCGANIASRNVDLHDSWHQRLWERLGGI